MWRQIVEAEIVSVIQVLKKSNLWTSYRYQETKDNPLLKNFLTLRESLTINFSCKANAVQIDSLAVVTPFISLLKSSEITSPIAHVVLSSIQKLLEADLLEESMDLNLKIRVFSLVAHSVAQCRFESIDSITDEFVLMKILQLLNFITSHPLCIYLPDSIICEIMETGFSICFQMRLSEVLRNFAEYSLHFTIKTIFSKWRDSLSFKTDPLNVDKAENDTEQHIKMAEIQIKPVDHEFKIEPHEIVEQKNEEMQIDLENNQTNVIHIDSMMFSSKKPAQGDDSLESLSREVAILSLSEKLQPSTILNENFGTGRPFGKTAMYEIMKFIISLIPPYDRQKSDRVRIIGLRLVLTAVEHLPVDYVHASLPELFNLLYDDLSRYLFQLLHVENSLLLSTNLKVLVKLLQLYKEHFKYHIELFINVLMDILQETEIRSYYYERAEIYLESLMQIVHLPNFLPFLFVHCDSNLLSGHPYEELINFIIRGLSNEKGQLDTINLICLNAIIYYLKDIISRYDCVIDNEEEYIPPKTLSEIRLKKNLLCEGAVRFNISAKDGISYLQKNGLLSDRPTPKEMSHFLKSTPNLNKKSIGEYLSKSDNIGTLKAFVQDFNFKGKGLEEALRLLLESFRLPGESAQIERIMEIFADYFFQTDPKEFKSKNAAFVLAYSVTMLNTDQHNPNVKNRMSLEKFIRNNKGINDNEDFSNEFLKSIYENIRDHEIIIPDEHEGELGFNYRWNEMLKKSKLGINNKDVERMTDIKMDGMNVHFYDKDMFDIVKSSMLFSLLQVYDSTSNEAIMTKVSSTLVLFANIASHFQDSEMIDVIISSLYRMTGLSSKQESAMKHFLENKKFTNSLQLIFSITKQYGNYIRESWKEILQIYISLFLSKFLPSEMNEMDDFLTGRRLINKKPHGKKKRDGFLSTISQYLSISSDSSIVSTASSASASSTDPHKERMVNVENERLQFFNELLKDSKPYDVLNEWRFLDEDGLIALIRALFDIVSKRIFNTEPPTLSSGASLENVSDVTVEAFILEMGFEIISKNRDRIKHLWPFVYDFIALVFADVNLPFLLYERCIVLLLRLCMRILHLDDMQLNLVKGLELCKNMPKELFERHAEQVMAGLYKLLSMDPSFIQYFMDKRVCFYHPLIVFRPKDKWDIVFLFISMTSKHPKAYSYSFQCLNLIFTEECLLKLSSSSVFLEGADLLFAFVAAAAPDWKKPTKASTATPSYNETVIPVEYGIKSMGILYRFFSIITRLVENKILSNTSYWNECSLPLLKGIGLYCYHPNLEIRQNAITILQRCILMTSLFEKSIEQLKEVFDFILFPLLNDLLNPDLFTLLKKTQYGALEESKMRVFMMTTKLFLAYTHLYILNEENIKILISLWKQLLEWAFIYHNTGSMTMKEAIVESLKNLLLVLSSSGILLNPETTGTSLGQDQWKVEFWGLTWDRVDKILPEIKISMYSPPPQRASVMMTDDVAATLGSSGTMQNPPDDKGIMDHPQKENQILTDPIDLSKERDSSSPVILENEIEPSHSDDTSKEALKKEEGDDNDK